MGIMDSLKSTVGKSGTIGATPLKAVEAFTMLLNQNGGIHGLIRAFEQHGVGPVIQSWISTRPNISIQPHQLRSVIGDGQLDQMSQKVGLDPQDLLQKLAQYLPQAVDKLTPGGQVHEEHFSTSNLLNLGKGLFH